MIIGVLESSSNLISTISSSNSRLLLGAELAVIELSCFLRGAGIGFEAAGDTAGAEDSMIFGGDDTCTSLCFTLTPVCRLICVGVPEWSLRGCKKEILQR